MPRQPMSRRRRRRKRSYGRKFLNTAEHALKVANQVKKLLNVEYKNLDRAETTTTPDSSGEIISLNHVGQGDTPILRNGNSVLNKSITFKYYMTPHASATDTFVRMVLIYDKYPNSTLATIAEIFSEARITGHLKLTAGQRFHVFKEFLVSVNSSSSENTIGKFYKEIDWHTKYDDTDATQNGIMSGQILLFMISNQATNTPSVHYSSRIRFLDN